MTDQAPSWAPLDSYLRQRLHVEKTPGLALAITNRERTLHIGAFGFADLAAKSPVTPQTLFEIGSIGKSFTAITLIQLAEAGIVDLHAPVSQYLPWFQTPATGEPVTIHHLLSHTAGITAGTDFSPEAHYQVWALRDSRIARPPGAAFHYSNLGYKALGLVLAEVLDQRYGEIIQERVLDPLGMTSSVPLITNAARSRLAVGYQPLHDDRPPFRGDALVPAPWIETETGDGSIAATPEDMAAYARMLLRHGAPILTPAGFARFTQHAIEVPGDGDPRYYGYGIFTRLTGGHTWLWHPGGMIGYFAGLIVDLDDGIGVVTMVNGPGRPVDIARAALAFAQAAVHAHPLPHLAVEDPSETENAADYVGTYGTDTPTFDLVADNTRLVLRRGGEQVVLEPQWRDAFSVNHSDFNRFLLRFERDDDGQVIAAIHGGDWYRRDGAPNPDAPAYPPEWDAYPGHYRSHNPWAPSFRVVLRRGRLWLIFPAEPDGFDDEQPLVALGNGLFQVGDDPAGPEWLHFDTVVNGQSLRAHLSDGAYYRFFMP